MGRGDLPQSRKQRKADVKIEIPKILKEIPLCEYHADFGAQTVLVWVNPSRKVGKRRLDLIRESLAALQAQDEAEADRLNAAMNAWYAEIWSQGEEAETHLSAEEVERACESSPDFVRWLIERTNALFLQQREQEKKA